MKPEALLCWSLQRGHVSGINNLHGEIQFNAFLGIINRMGVRLIGGEDLEVLSPGDPSTPFNTSDKITIKLDPREIAVYDYPREGLEEELSI